MTIHSAAMVRRDDEMSTGPAWPANVVEAESVSFTYPNGRRAIKDLDLNIGAGEIVGIVGPSGCGKSTFLNVLADSEVPDSGRLARPTLGDLTMMFQNNTLLPWRTVEKNVTLGFSYLKREAPSQEYVDDLLRLGRLTDVAHNYPKELSGGMRRRVAFLTTLAVKPKLILLDEPFFSLELRDRSVIAFNAMPRVALIPIIVVVVGPTVTSSVIASVLVVFFVVFFNAFEGATQVPADVIRNVRVLGASRVQQTTRIRLPYVMGWVSAAIPNAVAFSLIAVVTAEILVGSGGIGRLLLNSVSAVDPTLTFSVVIFLSVVGIALVVGSDYIRGRVLHWW